MSKCDILIDEDSIPVIIILAQGAYKQRQPQENLSYLSQQTANNSQKAAVCFCKFYSIQFGYYKVI